MRDGMRDIPLPARQASLTFVMQMIGDAPNAATDHGVLDALHLMVTTRDAASVPWLDNAIAARRNVLHEGRSPALTTFRLTLTLRQGSSF